MEDQIDNRLTNKQTSQPLPLNTKLRSVLNIKKYF